MATARSADNATPTPLSSTMVSSKRPQLSKLPAPPGTKRTVTTQSPTNSRVRTAGDSIQATPPPPPRPARSAAPHPASVSSNSQSSPGAGGSPSIRQRAVTLSPGASPKNRPQGPTPNGTPIKLFSSSKNGSPNTRLSLPWSPFGVLDSKTAALMEKSPASLQRNLSMATSTSTHLTPVHIDITPSEWDGQEDLELITDIDNESVVDEELDNMFHQLKVYHNRKITHYKRLLEQSQSSSSSQLHALQAEVRMLRSQLEYERGNMRDLELTRAVLPNGRTLLFRDDDNEDHWNLGDILKVDFNEIQVQRAVKALKRKDRRRLIGIILDTMLPTDIAEQIRVLQKYAKTAFDVVGMLPKEIGVRILKYFSVMEILGFSTISRAWYNLVHHPSIWHHHTIQLTSPDPLPPHPPPDPSGWEPLYKSLHHRESNFRHGLPQNIKFLNGHNNFCTTVILRGKRLISGSYDETIRFWDIETGLQTKCLHVKKPVSCIDFLSEEEVFVCGFHDVGRVHLFSSVTFAPLQQLQGHLYGIRAVAMSSKHLVSAGADKALVCWDWRLGTKIVRFGQQTNLNIGVQIIGSSISSSPENERVVSVTIDGIVRVFSIQRREMMSQFKLSELGIGDALLGQKIASVGLGANNMLQWFAANGNQMTCATKNMILHLQWSESEEDQTPLSPTQELLSPVGTDTTLSGPQSPLQSSRPSLSGNRVNSLSLSRNSIVTPTPQRRVSGPSAPINGLTKKPRLSLGIKTPVTPSTITATSPTATSNSSPVLLSASILNTSIAGRAGVAAVLTAPPKIVAVIETPDVAVGVMDPKRRRVVTATRFSSRAGAEKKIFISTHDDNRASRREPLHPSVISNSMPPVYYDAVNTALKGTWSALEDTETQEPIDYSGLMSDLPTGFKGLAAPNLNPMSMALSHQEIVVGCADGTIYVMSMLGYRYKKDPSEYAEQESQYHSSDEDDYEEEL